MEAGRERLKRVVAPRREEEGAGAAREPQQGAGGRGSPLPRAHRRGMAVLLGHQVAELQALLHRQPRAPRPRRHRGLRRGARLQAGRRSAARRHLAQRLRGPPQARRRRPRFRHDVQADRGQGLQGLLHQRLRLARRHARRARITSSTGRAKRACGSTEPGKPCPCRRAAVRPASSSWSCCCGSACASRCAAVAADGYPSRPIRLIVAVRARRGQRHQRAHPGRRARQRPGPDGGRGQPAGRGQRARHRAGGAGERRTGTRS